MLLKREISSRSLAQQFVKCGSYRTQKQGDNIKAKVRYFDQQSEGFSAYLLLLVERNDCTRIHTTRLYSVCPVLFHADSMTWHKRSSGWYTDTNEDGVSMSLAKKTSDQFWIQVRAEDFYRIAQDK